MCTLVKGLVQLISTSVARTINVEIYHPGYFSFVLAHCILQSLEAIHEDVKGYCDLTYNKANIQEVFRAMLDYRINQAFVKTGM